MRFSDQFLVPKLRKHIKFWRSKKGPRRFTAQEDFRSSAPEPLSLVSFVAVDYSFRALLRKLVLEELLASEVLEGRVMGPAFANRPLLQQKKPDVAVQRRSLTVDKVPGDLACELRQLMI
jgi:hypothetical protein